MVYEEITHGNSLVASGKKNGFLWNYNNKAVENVLSAYELLMGGEKT